jgi:hypothetical protein
MLQLIRSSLLLQQRQSLQPPAAQSHMRFRLAAMLLLLVL